MGVEGRLIRERASDYISDYIGFLCNYRSMLCVTNQPHMPHEGHDACAPWRRFAASIQHAQHEPVFMHLGAREGGSALAVARGHVMRMSMLSKDPKIVRVKNFVTRAEAKQIIQLAQDAAWLRSDATDIPEVHTYTSDSDQRSAEEERDQQLQQQLQQQQQSQGQNQQQTTRTVGGRSNKWCCVGHEARILTTVIERACWLTGLAPSHAEELQVVHYSVGQQYQLHVDHYTDRDVRDASVLEPGGGNRLVSMFVYLSDCEEGGHTCFPTVGVDEPPVCGGALLWHNIDKRGLLDARTLHPGEPILKGSKWGMNIWLRQRPRDRAAVTTWPRTPAPPLTATTEKARDARTLKERNV